MLNCKLNSTNGGTFSNSAEKNYFNVFLVVPDFGYPQSRGPPWKLAHWKCCQNFFSAELEKVPPFVLLSLQFNISPCTVNSKYFPNLIFDSLSWDTSADPPACLGVSWLPRIFSLSLPSAAFLFRFCQRHQGSRPLVVSGPPNSVRHGHGWGGVTRSETKERWRVQ